jgi:hypothetical protein
MPNPAGERLARLSRVATIRAAALTGRLGPEPQGSSDLAAVLYRAGGCAPSREIDARWPQLLLRRAERPVRAALSGHTRSATAAWMSWTRTDADPSQLVHKIYVSPGLAAMAEALTTTFAVAIDLGVPAWKVGADVAGLHRADKIVLYLPTGEAADRAASALAEVLNHIGPQGVPFTGQVGATGIVSRGIDHDGTSWRALVCRSLADALVAARAVAGPTAPPTDVADLAYERLADLGFDVTTWRPQQPPHPTPQPQPQPMTTGAVR